MINLIEQAIELHDRLTLEYNRAMAQWTTSKAFGEEEKAERYDQRTDRLLGLIGCAQSRIERRMQHVTYALWPNAIDPQRQNYVLQFFFNGRCVRTDRFPYSDPAQVRSAVDRLPPLRMEPYHERRTKKTIRELGMRAERDRR